MGHIYESLATLVLPQIAGAVGGHGTFYHRPLKQKDRRNTELCPVGIFFYFLFF